jgi:RNA polymerase sigma factor (sigma-70 family)
MANTSLDMVLRHLRGLTGPHPGEAATDGQLLERFRAGHEEAAFAGLLRRHGPMVLGVCRRVLGHAQDAEDVFQATFLLLARKAGSIRKGESVGSWLHRVANRLAVKARARTALHRRHETEAAARHTPEAGVKAAWRELEAVLDEEVQQLPAAFRAPLLLCYLEGQTQEEASRRLGCPLGTVRSRLARARDMLRKRLARRGLTLSAAALATALTAQPAAALPGALLTSTLKAGLDYAAGTAAAGNVSARAAALAEGGWQTMSGIPLKIGLAVVLAAGLIAAGAGMLPLRTQAENVAAQGGEVDLPARAPSKDQDKKPAAKKPGDKQLVINGQVLTADGKPVANAQVGALAHFRLGKSGEEDEDFEEILGNTRTDRKGRFRLRVRQVGEDRLESLKVTAAAAGHGLDWQALRPSGDRAEVTIRLRPEQAFRGRLVDLQGQGAAKVQVHLRYVVDPRARTDGLGLWRIREGLSHWPRPVTTDAQGRFVLRGLGRDLIIGLGIRDERFGRQDLHRIATRDGKEVTLLLAAPQRVEGQVTFADTGKPVSGVRLQIGGSDREINKPTMDNGWVAVRTDAKGRYRIMSHPGNTISVTAHALPGTPYLGIRKDVAWPKGAAKLEINVALPRGVLVRGKVTEAPSGKGVAGVRVELWPQQKDNPFWRSDIKTGAASRADGTFQIAVLPGPGYLCFQSSDRHYIQQLVYRDIESGKIFPQPIAYPDRKTVQRPYPNGQPLFMDAWHTLNLKPAAKVPDVKVVLRRGRTVQGRLLDPSGKPVARAQMLCRLPMGSYGFITLGSVEVGEGRFTLTGCDPDLVYPVLFLDARHSWGAVVQVCAKRAGKPPMTVRLARCGSAVVRLCNAQGQPLANYRLDPLSVEVVLPPTVPAQAKTPRPKLPPAESLWLATLDPGHYGDGFKTDEKGRVTLPALIPGANYRLVVRGHVRQFKAESGKQMKLADIVIQ